MTTAALEARPLPQTLVEVDDETRRRFHKLLDAGTPDNTRIARRKAFRYFWTWAEVARQMAEHYPVGVPLLVRFVVDHLEGLPLEVDLELVRRGVKQRLGTHSLATVQARVSHLSKAHRVQGLESPADSPAVRELLSAARKLRAKEGGQQGKAAIVLQDLGALLATTREGRTIDLRDRALILVAWGSGGRRRSEIVAAQWQHFRAVDDDFVWTVPRSKTDQEGEGRDFPVTGRAAAALRTWRSTAEDAGIDTAQGPVFLRVSRGGRILTGSPPGLSGQAVANLLKARARAAGLDPKVIAGHSLRAGFATAGADAGHSLTELMKMTDHKTVASIMRYYRGGASLHSNAARLVG